MDGDIPLAEAQLIWDWIDEKPIGDEPPAKVIRRGARDDDRYSASWGACNAEFNATDDAGRLRQLLLKFHELTVEGDLEPKPLHEALLVIPEYRRAIHPMHNPRRDEEE